MPWSACGHAARLVAIRTKPHRFRYCRRQSTITVPHARFLPLLFFQQQNARGYYAMWPCPTKQPSWKGAHGWRPCDLSRNVQTCFPSFPITPICFLLDLLQLLLLKLLLLSRSAHSNAVRLKIPHPLRTARVPAIELSSRGFSCCCTCQPPQGYHPPCMQLRLHLSLIHI